MRFRLRFSLRKGAGPRTGLVRHRVEVRVAKTPGQTDEDRKAMMREIEAELERQMSARNSPEATRAAIDEIVRRHGAEIESFDEH